MGFCLVGEWREVESLGRGVRRLAKVGTSGLS